MEPEPLRVRLLNDYEVVVAGLAVMLEPFRDRVRVVEADVRAVTDRPVDVTLYDTFGRGAPDPEDLAALVADPATGAVVVYTWGADRAAVRDGWAGLGLECLDKTLPATELVREIERIAGRGVGAAARGASRGAAAEAPRASGRLVESQSSWPGKDAGLSLREAEVIALITQGHTNAEISASLYLSPNSLKTYIRTAYRKMGVERRSQAVRWGIEHGMLPSTPRTSLVRYSKAPGPIPAT